MNLTIRIQRYNIPGLEDLYTEAVVVEVNPHKQTPELVALCSLLHHQALQIVSLHQCSSSCLV